MFKYFGVFVSITLIALGLMVVTFIYSVFPKPVKTHTISIGKAVEAVYATAVVEPVTWSAIAPARMGRIQEINVNEGDFVKKGDILARLEDEDLRAQLVEEKALNEYYDSQVQRIAPLVATGGTSVKDLEQRQTDLARSSARIKMIEEQIKQLSLPAPIDGTILWRDVELGEVKEPGKPLFWVGLPRPLRLIAEVDEEDIPKIKTGQSVFISADAFPGEALNGTIHWISPKGDSINKSYRVYVGLPDDTKLMIGMTVETNTIIQENDNVTLAPAEAVTEDSYLWVVTQESGRYTARKTPVNIGIRGEEYLEITDGVKVGDQVILPPWDELSDGAYIRIE